MCVIQQAYGEDDSDLFAFDINGSLNSLRTEMSSRYYSAQESELLLPR